MRYQTIPTIKIPFATKHMLDGNKSSAEKSYDYSGEGADLDLSAIDQLAQKLNSQLRTFLNETSDRSPGWKDSFEGRIAGQVHETLSQIDNELKNDLQTFMNSGRPLPTHEPLEGENVMVNTLVIETLFKTVLSQVLIHHHRHTQSIIDQNARLIEENKMLLAIVGNIVCSKNNIRSETDLSDENESNNSSDNDAV